MRLVRSDTSLRRKDADKRNSHRNSSEAEFRFSNRDINFSKEREKNEDVSFVVDRSGVKDVRDGDACTKHHRLTIKYCSELPVQKLTDHSKEAKDESRSKVQLGSSLEKRPEYAPRKHHVLRKQSSAIAKRYHVEDDPRFSALKPGIISESLRDALGINGQQLPLYIYKMRRLGYPPGHLENARRQQSGILIFTKDGCEVTPQGKILEEGEVSDHHEEVLFDVDKLIDFPGFNIHPPDGTLDECESFDLPFMQADHGKEEMMRLLSSACRKERTSDAEQNLEEAGVKEAENSLTIPDDGHAVILSDSRTAYKTKSYSEERMAIWLTEMGLSAADGWLVLDSLPDLDDDHFQSSTCPESSTDRNSSDRSLPAHQSQTGSVKKTLKRKASVLLHECPPTKKTLPQDLPSSDQESTILEPRSDSGFSEDVMLKSSDFEQQNSSAYGGSLDVTPGTPVVVVDSKFWSKGLPDASRFSLGMSEQLPYENLPDATGAFQKLRRVLNAARCRRTRNH